MKQIADTIRDRAFIQTAGRTIRTSAGVSYSQVAGALNVAPSTVFRWETGKRTPRPEQARQYAELLREIASAR